MSENRTVDSASSTEKKKKEEKETAKKHEDDNEEVFGDEYDDDDEDDSVERDLREMERSEAAADRAALQPKKHILAAIDSKVRATATNETDERTL